MGRDSIFINDNTRALSVSIVGQGLKTKTLLRKEWPLRLHDFNPIEYMCYMNKRLLHSIPDILLNLYFLLARLLREWIQIVTDNLIKNYIIKIY